MSFIERNWVPFVWMVLEEEKRKSLMNLYEKNNVGIIHLSLNLGAAGLTLHITLALHIILRHVTL